LQIKYRYDIEVGRGKRSCLRKIFEKDDTSLNKLFILFVSEIYGCINDKLFIELCDGWYAIRALCDSYLEEYVKKERLKVGDKLAIFSCELVNSPYDGCSPLDVRKVIYIIALFVFKNNRNIYFYQL
jgi:hypothetical protein